MFIKQALVGMVLTLFILPGIGCVTGITHIPDPPVYDPGPFEPGKTVAENKDGWRVKRYTHKSVGGFETYYFEMWDPVLKKWYPAVSVGNNEVTMSDNGKRLWRRDRMDLPEERRFEALQNKPEVESNEEIDFGGGCFSPGTPVLMADGGLREISKIKDGEMVKSYNIQKGIVEDRQVTQTYLFQTEGYYLINDELKATSRHKFLLAVPENKWKEAAELRVGDWLKTLDGQVQISSIEYLKEDNPAHNFRVADTKAYIVKGGDKYYIVHNGL